jgi:hypothetical protein
MENKGLKKTALGSLVFVLVGFGAWFVFYPEKLEQVNSKTQESATLEADQSTHDARGFGSDSARVDSQITYSIPEGKAEEVYQYLKKKYAGQPHVLTEEFPGLNLSGGKMSDESLFVDVYYDTPNLDLYKTRNSVRFRTRVNTTNPDDRKSGRQLVQVKVTPPGQFEMRSELKFKVETPKKPSALSETQARSLLGVVDSDQREDLARTFIDAEINPFTLRHVFTISQMRKRVYIEWDGKGIMTFSIDTGSASVLWATGRYSSVDMAITEIAYTEGNEEKRKTLWAIRDAFIADLKKQFDGLSQTSDSKYGLVMERLAASIPGLPRMIRYNLVN